MKKQECKEQETHGFRVEKFIPTMCPECHNPFTENNSNGFLIGTYWIHEERETTKKIAQSISAPPLSTDLVICGKCKNITLRVKIDEKLLKTKEEAEAMLADGFSNIKPVHFITSSHCRPK